MLTVLLNKMLMAVVTTTAGYLSERFGRRAIFTLAMSLFLAGTIIAAAAASWSLRRCC